MHEPTFRKALRDGRPQPVLPGDGQHPRAVQLGPRRPSAARPRRPRPWSHAAVQPRRSATSRWSGCRSTCAPTRWSSAAASPGMTAALELADAGNHVYLVERQRPPRRQPGPRRPHRALPRLRPRHADRAHHPRGRARQHRGPAREPRSSASTGSSATSRPRSAAPAERPPTATRKVDVGSVIVCTGYKEFDAARITHYGYGKLPERHHLVRVREDAARRPHRDQGGPAAAVRRHHPLRGQPQRGVPRLLLAGLLHDGAQVRPRGQVGAARAPTSPTSTSTCTPSARAARTSTGELRGQDAVPHVRARTTTR